MLPRAAPLEALRGGAGDGERLLRPLTVLAGLLLRPAPLLRPLLLRLLLLAAVRSRSPPPLLVRRATQCSGVRWRAVAAAVPQRALRSMLAGCFARETATIPQLTASCCTHHTQIDAGCLYARAGWRSRPFTGLSGRPSTGRAAADDPAIERQPRTCHHK